MSGTRTLYRLQIEEFERRIAPAGIGADAPDPYESLLGGKAPLPVVKVKATDADASEWGPDIGTFSISRTGSTANPLVVYYTVGGTATPDVDYQPALSGTLTLGAGVSSETITITPIFDTDAEGKETVILTLSTSGSYTVGSPGSDTITISDPVLIVSSTSPLPPFTDSDQDTISITMSGPGSAEVTLSGITAGDIVSIDLSKTDSTTVLTIKDIDPWGPNTLVGGIIRGTTPLLTLNLTPGTGGTVTATTLSLGNALGTLNISGKLGPVGTYGDSIFHVSGSLGTAKISGGVTNGTFRADKDFGAFKVAGGMSGGGFTAGGNCKSITIAGEVAGPSNFTIGGSAGAIKIGGMFSNSQLSVKEKAPSIIFDKGTVELSAISVGGGIGTLKVGGALLQSQVTVGNGLGSFKAKQGILGGSILIVGGTAGIGTITVTGGGFDGTVRATAGGLKSLAVNVGDLSGWVEARGTAGIGTVSAPKGRLNGATISASHLGGSIKTVKALTGATGVLISAGQGVGSVTVSGTTNGGSIEGNIIANGFPGIGTISAPKGGFTGTMQATIGPIKSVRVGGNLVGSIQAGGTADIGTISVNKGGFSGTVGAAAGGIKSLNIAGAITAGTVISAGGTAGIGTLSVQGDADLTLTSKGKLGAFNMKATLDTPCTLKGVLDVEILPTLNAPYARLDDVTIRAPQGIGKVNVLSIEQTIISAGSVGSVTVSQDMKNSLILAGYDIGGNHVFEYEPGNGDDAVIPSAKANIGTITIGGSMIGTSIAANVKCGEDHVFGINDLVLVENLTAGIKALTVKGVVSGGSSASGIQFGIVGQTMGKVTIAGEPCQPGWTSGDAQVAINLVSSR